MVESPCVWKLFGFDHGGRRYGYEISRDGRHARVVIDGQPKLELPVEVWGAILTAIGLQQAAKAATPASGLAAGSAAGAPPTGDPAGRMSALGEMQAPWRPNPPASPAGDDEPARRGRSARIVTILGAGSPSAPPHDAAPPAGAGAAAVCGGASGPPAARTQSH